METKIESVTINFSDIMKIKINKNIIEKFKDKERNIIVLSSEIELEISKEIIKLFNQ